MPHIPGLLLIRQPLKAAEPCVFLVVILTKIVKQIVVKPHTATAACFLLPQGALRLPFRGIGVPVVL